MRRSIRALLAAVAVSFAGVTTAGAATSPLDATEVSRHATAKGDLTPADRAALRELGIAAPSSAVVIVRRIPKRGDGHELARLQMLARAPEGFAPSGACDELSARGQAQAFCRGHVDGPFGSVAARMPIGATLVEHPGGSELVLRNIGPLEVKPLLSWSEVVAPGHVVIAYRLDDENDAWRVTARVAVEMTAHADSAKTLTDTLLKAEAWLTRDLLR